MKNEDVSPLNFNQKSISISSLLKLIKDGLLTLEYFVAKDTPSWDNNMKSQFIESFLIRAPLYPYIVQRDLHTLNVIDGMHRLVTLRDFFNDKFELTNLKFLHSLNGSKFSDLARPIQRRIEETNVGLHSIESILNPDMACRIAISYK